MSMVISFILPRDFHKINKPISLSFFSYFFLSMSRLISSVHSDLTQPVLEALFKRSIYTALAFVQSDPEFIARITGLQYKKVLLVRNSILSKFASAICYGYNYYQELMHHCAIIGSGISQLDDLLDGGFLTGDIYEICGTTASGKTQLCLTIAVNICTTLHLQNVLYIDTKNDVYAHRIVDIIEKKKSSKCSNVGALMQKIKLHKVSSMYELLTLLHQIRKDLSESEGKNLGYRFIVIDSLAAVFYQFLSDQQNEGLSLLNNVANVLHHIAVEYHIAILITNLVTTWTTDANEAKQEESLQSLQQIQQPALGKYWAHVPSTRIRMKKFDNRNECLLTVIKSTSLLIGKTVKLALMDSGVQ